MSKLRLGITMSVDGYVAGPNQSSESPLGVGGMELHEWFFPLKESREMHGEHGGEVNASSAVMEERRANPGATIMGRNMFGPARGPWPDESWRGWWGEVHAVADNHVAPQILGEPRGTMCVPGSQQPTGVKPAPTRRAEPRFSCPAVPQAFPRQTS